jgi:molybdopterin-guanine dinucleotide biosynthesis protein A
VNITALILAGGQARRMGRDKRLLEYQGKPLIRHTLEAAQAVSDEIWLLLASEQGKQALSPFVGEEARFLVDARPGCGPLAALVDALPQVQSEYAMLLAADYPLLTGPFLMRMKCALEAEKDPPDALIPLYANVPQVACAFYRQSLHQELQEAFLNDERSLRRWVMTLAEHRVKWLLAEECTKWGYPHVFFNVNTPQDYERLLRFRS